RDRVLLELSMSRERAPGMTAAPSLAWAVGTLLALVLVGCAGTGEPGGPLGPGAGNSTSASGPLTLADDGRTLWVVNPDSDSVTAVDVTQPERPEVTDTVAVGAEPWAVAVAPSGSVVVMNRRSGNLSFLQR